jgi:hypothetical protein
MLTWRTLLIVLGWTCVMLSGAGCGAGLRSAETIPPASLLANSGLPGLDALAELAPSVPRVTSGTYHLNGNDAVESNPSPAADPFTATAPIGEYRHAIYGGFPVNDVSRPLTLVLNLDGSAGTVWVGLSNYTTGRWEWQAVEAPFSTWMEVPLTTTGDVYYNASDKFYFALVVYDGDTLHFEGANIDTTDHWLINPASWLTHTIASGANFGKHHSACLLDNGAPGIVYTRDDSDDICFAYATQLVPGAPGDWVSHTADSGADRGGSVDICLSNGKPAIVYEDVNRADVYYALASKALPTAGTDWASHQPDTNAQVQPRLANLAGRDFILYRGIGGLKIAHALTAAPASAADWEFATVDSGASSYDFLQLAMHPDGPVAAYKRLEGGPAKLYYAWSDALDGGSLLDFNTIVVDDSYTNCGNNAQLVLGPDHRAWIAFTDVNIVHFMRFAYANTETPASAADFTTTDVFGQEQTHTGQYMGLGCFADRPLFSFIETGSGAVAGIHAIYPNRELSLLSGVVSFDHTLLYEPSASELVNEETEVLTLSNGYPAVIFRTNGGLQFSYFPVDAAP